jgi:hypothetical protein
MNAARMGRKEAKNQNSQMTNKTFESFSDKIFDKYNGFFNDPSGNE